MRVFYAVCVMAAFDRCQMKTEAMKTVAPDLSEGFAPLKRGSGAEVSSQVLPAASLAFGLYGQDQERNALPFSS